MNERSGRRRGALALRFLVAAAGLVLAFWWVRPDSGGSFATALADAWRRPLLESAAWFAAGCGLLGVNLAVGAIRFGGLLRGIDLRIRWSTLFRAYLVAGFFNLVLPGGMLGDVYRLVDARRDVGEGGRVLGLVVAERLLGLGALGAVALAAAPAIARIHDDPAWVGALAGLAAATVLATLALLLPGISRRASRAVRPLEKVSPRAGRASARALDAVDALSRRPKVVATAFGWSLVNQGLPVLAVGALAVPFDSPTAWYWFVVIVPFVTLVSLLPISIGGTGVRELLYVTLFGATGMRPEAALALSLSVLAATVSWGAVGLAVFASGRGDDRETRG